MLFKTVKLPFWNFKKYCDSTLILGMLFKLLNYLSGTGVTGFTYSVLSTEDCKQENINCTFYLHLMVRYSMYTCTVYAALLL
jgi:hypothetical protein